MPEAASFHFAQSGPGGRQRAPLVLLHGSSGSERSLLDFAHRIAPDRAAFGLRGHVPWDAGFAFFRRHADRTLDLADLAARCAAFCGFLQHLSGAGYPKPLLAGYSNGAIMAAAAVLRAPALSAGAILLRPLSPSAETVFPPLPSYPVLLLGGAADDRRDPSDTPHLAQQFRQSGAQVTSYLLVTGHRLGGEDERVSRDWLAARP